MAACAAVPCLLELFPATRVLEWIRGIPARPDDAVAPEHLALHVDRLLLSAPAIWRHTCLRRAATLAALLRRSGHDAELVIGVRRAPDGGVEAHAWLEHGGKPWLERESVEGFAPLRGGEGC